MIKTISWFAYLWWYLLKPNFKLIKLNRQGRHAERNVVANIIAREWAQRALANNGSSINVIGIENVPETGGVLFVANHQGNFDIPILIGHVPRDKGFIAKAELLNFPFLNKYMKYIDCIFIDRKDARQSLIAMDKAAENLKEGHSLVIFPEGTRSADGTIGKFKPGSLKLALKAGVPIVPITLNGSMNIMPKGSSLIGSASVKVVIAPPILYEEYNGMDSNEIAQKVRSIIVSNQCC